MGEVLHESFGSWGGNAVAVAALVAFLFGVHRRLDGDSVRRELLLSVLFVGGGVLVVVVNVLLVEASPGLGEASGIDLRAAIVDASSWVWGAGMFVGSGFWAGWTVAGPISAGADEERRT